MNAILLDVQQTAEMLTTSERTVRRMTADGTLPGFRKLGSQSRWHRGVLEAWAAAGCPPDAESFELHWRRKWSGVATAGQVEKWLGEFNTTIDQSARITPLAEESITH